MRAIRVAASVTLTNELVIGVTPFFFICHWTRRLDGTTGDDRDLACYREKIRKTR